MQKRVLLMTLACAVALLARGNETATRSDSGSKEHSDHHACATTPHRTDPFEGLTPIQQRMLANLAARHQQDHPLALCFAPGTPQSTIDRFNAAIAPVDSFRIHPSATRWTSTATDGSGIQRGVPLTLRYSFLADGVAIPSGVGEPAAPNNLIAFLNGIYGNQATWQPLFQQVFDRWSELSGITYVYEPNDDSAAFPSSPGVVGVRGDVRIGGHFIDGNSGTLAYNFYPTTGDMVIDTGDTTFYGNTSSSSIRLRNVLAHEAGHGLGFQHVCPVNQTKLMEPFAATSFNGPQHDDILAVHRNYGDNYGQIGTTATSANLGLLANQTLVITNVSIDGSGELDLFKFTLDGSAKWVSVTVSPIGSSYLEGAQNGDGSCSGGTTFNSQTVVDLNLQLLDVNGTTVLGTANSNPIGQSETLTNVLLTSSGPYYIRVAGDATDNVQLYQLNITVATAALSAPTIIAEPATTPGTSNTIYWNALQAMTAPTTKQAGTGSGSTTEATKTLNAGAVDAGGTHGATAPKIQLAQRTLPAGPIVSESIEQAKESFEASPVWQGIFTETFEGAFPGTSWTRFGTPTWDDVNTTAHSGSWSGWCAASTMSPAGGYANDMNSWMVYGPFSLADATSARVNFWLKNDSEQDYDFVSWFASTDGSNFSGYQTTGENDWSAITFDLANAGSLGNLCGQSQVWIAFHFSSDDSFSGAEGYMGAFVDDIVIEKDVASLPDLTTYMPTNWNDKIPIGTNQLALNDAHSYTGAYYDNKTLYFNWAAINSGSSTAGTYTVRAEVTGTGGGAWTWTVPNNPVNQWFGSTTDQAVGPLAAGTHTFKVWVDVSNTVTEASEANNYYERTITVSTVVPFEYYAEASTSSGFSSPVGSGWISGTQHTFTNLTPGQTYYYRVKARQGANESPWSSTVNSQQQAVPILYVTPGSHSFGSIQTGGIVDRTFNVTNTGTGTLSGSASVSAPFSIFSGGSYNLSAGQGQSVVVRYSPVSAGTHNANVIFTGGSGMTNQVSGTATNANTPPTVTINSPTTANTFSTNKNTINIAGTATDNAGVTSVTWSNSRGGSGTAVGTTSWSVSNIILQPGTNTLTVTAYDAALATGTDTLSVVFIPPNIFHSFGRTNGHFSFALDGQVGRAYLIQYSTNLVSWPTLVTLTNTTGTVTYTDTAATNSTRFYRAVAQ